MLSFWTASDAGAQRLHGAVVGARHGFWSEVAGRGWSGLVRRGPSRRLQVFWPNRPNSAPPIIRPNPNSWTRSTSRIFCLATCSRRLQVLHIKISVFLMNLFNRLKPMDLVFYLLGQRTPRGGCVNANHLIV